ncbi:hypothetical protein F4677DRAFT_427594 [Hypoxylon crocopeplum]|nr:hypothetical protein F4677DRAFT_427594 [Hypoxylon crocopeplum]
MLLLALAMHMSSLSSKCGVYIMAENKIPNEDEDEFRQFIKRKESQSHDQRKRFQPESSHFSTWENAPNSMTYSSFGDNGTIASVNMYGDIMQFGTYLGVADSGMFSADHGYTNEPYCVCRRAEDMDALSRGNLNNLNSYGFQFSDLEFEEPPRLTYLHYRWPRYEYRRKDRELTIQWIVHDGVVLQQCILTNLEDTEVDISFNFRTRPRSMRIRDSDYLDSSHRFNDSYCDYSERLGPHDYSWILMHDLEHKSEADDLDNDMFGEKSDVCIPVKVRDRNLKIESDSVAVVVSIFHNGEALQWTDEPRWTKKLEGAKSKRNVMEVTTAYRMISLPASEVNWKNFLIPVELADVDSLLQNTPFSNFCLSMIDICADDHTQARKGKEDGQSIPEYDKSPSGIPDHDSTAGNHIEFITRRNLEHILSVCSIPLKSKPLESELSRLSEPSESICPVALTCGDIAFHRVCTAASFFGIQFLVESASRLKKLKEIRPDDQYVDSLLSRISKVCQGHFMWLSQKAERKSEDFVANYWVTGKAMDRSSSSWQPDDSLTDTAFQLLKAKECAAFYEKGDLDLKVSSLNVICKAWIEKLDRLDRRAHSAWPHTEQAGTNVFRLDDHVWIWRALKAVEELDVWPKLDGKRVMRPARQVQQEMLRRFTTENETSRKRMLATTRSSRETRFLLHAQDTALLYDYDWISFSQQTSFREIWGNTLEAQSLHEINHNIFWDNTLRYALSIMMGLRGVAINKQSAPNLVKSFLRVIFQSTALNGFCPGELDEITKEPVLFSREEDRDYYFRASFEIPFILFKNAIRIDSVYSQHLEQSDSKANRPTETQPDLLQSDTNENSEGRKAQPKRQHALMEEGSRESSSMKKTVPFSRLFDSNSIIDIEEEWLYNYPSFLSKEKETTKDDINDTLRALKEQEIDAGADEHVIIKEARGVTHCLDKGEKGEEWVVDGKAGRALIADVQKTRRRRKEQRALGNDPFMHDSIRCTNSVLKNQLMGPREAINAKKRFIWLPNANPETALICFLGSTDVEQPAISLFFDRHWHQDEYFFDDTTMMMNTWETELHLSFYQLLDTGENPTTGLRTLSEDVFPGEKKRIGKTSMGFRFNGDFFDRYWTCHFIEDKGRMGWDLPFPHQDKEQGWRQRKVLELYLFEHILTTLIKRTREILNEVKRGLEVQQGQGAFSSAILTSEDYFFSSAQWQRFQNILQIVDEKLGDVILEVSKWESREKDRGQERPRWTRNDERKYGGIIKKFLRSTNKQIRNLHSVHASIKSLKETLLRGQDQTRDDLSLRGSEDIRFFTYVTVVFLPLGFASSVFSMSGTPAPDLIVSLVICAAVALALTVFALFNAKALAYVTQRTVRLIEKYSQSKMESSFLIVGSEDDKKKSDEEATGPAQNNHLERKNSPSQNSSKRHNENYGPKSLENASQFWFLVAYVILEFPARRVAIAYDVLSHGKPTLIGGLNVMLGILCLPFCVIVWLTQVGVCNAMDLFKLLFDLAIWFLPSSKPDDTSLKRYMKWIALPLDNLRPMKGLGSKLKEDWSSTEKEKEKGEKDQEQEQEQVKGTDSQTTEGNSIGTVPP